MMCCSKCSVSKDKSQFYRRSSKTDRRLSWCRTCFNQGGTAYRRAHKEISGRINSRYYERHKEEKNKKTVVYQRNKYRTDPIYRAKDAERKHNRRALKIGNGGKHSYQEWEEVKKSHDYLCAHCGLPKPLTRDHIIPLTKGGTNNISNIQPLCLPCNASKGNRVSDLIKAIRGRG